MALRGLGPDAVGASRLGNPVRGCLEGIHQVQALQRAFSDGERGPRISPADQYRRPRRSYLGAQVAPIGFRGQIRSFFAMSQAIRPEVGYTADRGCNIET